MVKRAEYAPATLRCGSCGNEIRFRVQCRELVEWEYDVSRGSDDARWVDHVHIGDLESSIYEVFCAECRTPIGRFHVNQL